MRGHISDRVTEDEFPATSWSLLDAVQSGGLAASRAMDMFARRYHGPVLAYFRALSGSEQQAEDLTQEFFGRRILTGRLLNRADRSMGGFRHYLKRAVRNHFLDTLRHDRRQKRGDGRAHVDLDASELARLPDPGGENDPDRVFHVAWVRSLLETAMAEVRRRCQERGQAQHLEIFAGRYLARGSPAPSWTEVGAVYGLDEKAARGRAETVARHLRSVLRGLIRTDLAPDQTTDDELATLRVLLGG